MHRSPSCADEFPSDRLRLKVYNLVFLNLLFEKPESDGLCQNLAHKQSVDFGGENPSKTLQKLIIDPSRAFNPLAPAAAATPVL